MGLFHQVTDDLIIEIIHLKHTSKVYDWWVCEYIQKVLVWRECLYRHKKLYLIIEEITSAEKGFWVL